MNSDHQTSTTSDQREDLALETAAKGRVAQEAARLAADAETEHARAEAAHVAATSAVDEARRAYESEVTSDAKVMSLAHAQNRHAIAKSAAEAAASRFESARRTAQVAAASHGEALATARKAARVAELEALVSSHADRMRRPALRVGSLLADLCAALDELHAGARATGEAACELAELTGTPATFDGGTTLLALLEDLHDSGAVISEHGLSPFQATRSTAWAAPLVDAVVAARARKSSPAQLEEFAALLEAMRSTSSLAEARHRVLCARVGPRQPVAVSPAPSGQRFEPSRGSRAWR